MTLDTDADLDGLPDEWDDDWDGWDEDWGDVDPSGEYGRPAGPPASSKRFGWRWFFSKPNHNGRPGTMPAGVVLVVGLATLVLLALLNAPATLRKSNAKDKGAWRQSTAQAVATLSDDLKLDTPRNLIDDARG